MERFIAAILLVLNIPLMAILYGVIKLTSKGSFFFTQQRAGKHKRPFTIYKIRTMVDGAHLLQKKLRDKNEADGPVFKIRNDPRLTRIGKILSHTGLDEILQLLNIIKGEMSFVGPRPLPLKEAGQVPREYQTRFAVKPGITSSWILAGSHRLSFKEWMQLDVEYVTNKNWLTDIKIFLLTIFSIMQWIIKRNF